MSSILMPNIILCTLAIIRVVQSECLAGTAFAPAYVNPTKSGGVALGVVVAAAPSSSALISGLDIRDGVCEKLITPGHLLSALS